MRDAETGAPIEGAALTQPASEEMQIGYGTAICISTKDGALVWDTQIAGDAFVIADGYLPHPLSDGDLEARDVMLRRGGAINVRVHSTLGNPLEGVKVVLRGARSPDHAIPDLDASIGNPYSPDPEWVSITDGAGAASFRGLPDKAFRLREWLEGYYPVTTYEAHRRVFTPADVRLTLEEVWGCAVTIPEGLEVASWAWSHEGRLETGANVLPSLEPNRKALERRYPGCICITAVPRESSMPAVMTCTATMSNGTIWRVSWPLARWTEITPVFLEQQVEIEGRQIRFGIQNPLGEAIPAAIAVYDKALQRRIPVVNGSCVLTPGLYRVVPLLVSPWLESLVEDPSFEVGPSSPAGDFVLVRLREQLYRVEVRLSVEAVGMDSVVRLRFLDAKGVNATILRASNQGPFVIYLPKGEYQLRARGLHYEAAEQSFDLSADKNIAIDLRRVAR